MLNDDHVPETVLSEADGPTILFLREKNQQARGAYIDDSRTRGAYIDGSRTREKPIEAGMELGRFWFLLSSGPQIFKSMITDL